MTRANEEQHNSEQEFSLTDIRWPVFTSSAINLSLYTIFHPNEVLAFVACPLSGTIEVGEVLSDYLTTYRHWTATTAFEESLKWGEMMQRDVIERMKGSREEKECAKRWFIVLGKVMTGIVSVLGDVVRFSESMNTFLHTSRVDGSLLTLPCILQLINKLFL